MFERCVAVKSRDSGISLSCAIKNKEQPARYSSLFYYTRVQEILFSVRSKAKVIKEIELPVSNGESFFSSFFPSAGLKNHPYFLVHTRTRSQRTYLNLVLALPRPTPFVQGSRVNYRSSYRVWQIGRQKDFTTKSAQFQSKSAFPFLVEKLIELR